MGDSGDGKLREELAALRCQVEELSVMRDGLDEARRGLAEKERLLDAYNQIGQAILSSLDLEEVLDRLARHVIQAGIFRSLMIALVHREEETVEVVRNFVCLEGGIENAEIKPGESIRPSVNTVFRHAGKLVVSDLKIVGATYSLEDENITPTVARTGELTILGGWSERFDERAGDPEARAGQVSYFIPIRSGDRVLAVLATGSFAAEETLVRERIGGMQPLLDQIAIALEHARIYGELQREIGERQLLAEELRQERAKLEERVEARTAELQVSNQALQESETRFRELAELLPETIYEMDLEGRLTFANRSAFERFGYPQADFDAGLSALEMIVPADRPRALDNLQRIIGGENIGLREYTCLRKDGRRFPALFHSTPIVRQGRPVGVIGFIVDITERKEMEQALQESEERFRSLFNNPHVGLFRSRLEDGRLLECNERLAEIGGYDSQEACMADFVVSERYVDPEVQGQIREQLQTTGEVREFDLQMTDRSGEPIWVSFSGRLYPEEGYMEGALVDIGERKMAEEMLLQSSRLVALGEMAAGLAHELNQPLTAISVCAEGVGLLMKRGVEVTQEMLDENNELILEQVARMQRLIEHLRLFSRDRSQVLREKVQINDVVSTALQLTGTQLKGHGIELQLELAENLGAVQGDPYRLEQVLLNLISNARDALDEEEGRLKQEEGKPDWRKWLSIRTFRSEEEGDEHVCVEVEDSGPGVAEENRKRLFQPFFTTKDPDKGTGLGLSLSYAIVKDHGGRIEYRGQTGEGARFRIWLPANQF